MGGKVVLLFLQLAGFITLVESGYLLTFPWRLTSKATHQFCMSFYNTTSDIEVKLNFRFSSKQKQITKLFNDGIGNCFNVAVPFTTDNVAQLEIEGKSVGDEEGYAFSNQHRLQISQQLLVILVQPDKPIYKPGQTVKFRVLGFTRDLKTWTGVIKKILIMDPNNTRIAQWMNVQSNGLISLEKTLSDEPVLGYWSITVKINNQKQVVQFKVDKYVLPKFKVIIKPPSYLLINSETVDLEICARYTYQKDVTGTVNGSVCIRGTYETENKRPCYNFTEKLHGCRKFSIDSNDLQLANKDFIAWYLKLKVDATVTEVGTGVQITESHDGPAVEQNKYIIQPNMYTRQYFKPGIPSEAKVIVTTPDEKPIPGETFQVTAIDNSRVHTYTGNYTTDEEGNLHIGVPALPTTIKGLTLEIVPASSKENDTDGDENLDIHFRQSSFGSFSLQQWYSPSRSFIWIDSIYKQVKCNQSIDAVFYYNAGEDTEDFKIAYLVLSRGKIVSNGEWSHSDSVETQIDEPEGLLIKEPISTTTTTATSTTEDEDSTPPIVTNNTFTVSPKIDSEQKEKEPEDKSLHTPVKMLRKFPQVEEAIVADAVADEPQKIYKQSLRIESDWGPEANVIIFYVRPDGEAVADSILIPIQKCFKNKVNMTFNKDKVRPGANTKMTIEATPFSLCAIGMVDESVHLLGGNNQITPDKIFKSLKQYNLQPASHIFSDLQHCRKYDPYLPPGLPPAIPSRFQVDSPGLPPAIPDVIDSTESKEDDEEIGVKKTEEKKSAKKKINKRKKKINKKKTDKSDDAASRRKRSYYFGSYSPYVDTSEAFKTAGLAVVTDQLVVTRPCEYDRRPMFLPVALQAPSNSYVIQDARIPVFKAQTLPSPEDSVPADVRSYFPETWLWDLQDVGTDGKLVMPEKVPDSITTWVGNTICTNNETGIGVSEPASLTVFKPFFVSYTLPYAAVRGEKLPLKVTVFNFLKHCINIKITLAKSKSYLISERPSKNNYCVCADKSHTVVYTIIPLQLGPVDINVTAKSNNNNNNGECGHKLIKRNLVTDIISKKLLVNAEGVSKEYTYNSFICMKKNDKPKSEMASLKLPKLHFVPDSERGRVLVIGDLMGPTLSGLENLVQMPYGCGEQNMVGFVPNIYVLDYLKSSNQNQSSLMDMAVKYMEKGYQRQLKYQHKDGTFSAFGETDEIGSTWLTAFVLRSFAKADQYIFIDNGIMMKMINWFVLNLRENNCFHEFGHVWSKHIKGGLDGGDEDVALTAYALITFLEIKIENRNVIKDAMKCLTNSKVNDTYTLSLMNYAFTLYGVQNEKWTEIKKILMSRAIEHDGLKYWTRDNKRIVKKAESWLRYDQAPSAEVEITSYVLLAMLTENSGKAVSKSLPIIQWLTKQRNAYGGFSSTQDTVLALQALSKYASYIYEDGLDLTVKLSGKQLATKFKVDDTNSLALQTADIKALPNEVNITTKGVGCALIQLNVRYNMYEVDSKTAPLHMSIVPEYLYACDRVRLEIKAGHNDIKGSTNMAVAEIKLPTGWIAHTESVEELVKVKTGQIRRAEIQNDGTQVNIYFDKLTVISEVFSFTILQTLGLKETKPAIAILYDYYEKSIRVAANYSVKTRCGVSNPGSDTVDDLKNQKEVALQADGMYRRPKHKLKTCPNCYTESSTNFTKLFCDSSAAYKIEILKDKSRVRVLCDERFKSKHPIDHVVQVNVPVHCKCDVLKTPETNALVLTKRKLYKEEKRKFHLNRWASIFPVNAQIKELIKNPETLCKNNL